MLRRCCSNAVDRDNIAIGGPGKIVEIDESLFTKIKHSRGKQLKIKRIWVFGGVERGTRNCFFFVVKDRKKETLLSLIFKHIAAGSIIYSDMWKSYIDICKLNKSFKHQMVNHSLHFVDPQTGVHTNNIESTWKTGKMKIKQMCGVDRRYVQEYLDEFVWRYSNYADRDTLFHCLIPTIENYYESNVGERVIDNEDLDDLSDASDMSEDEDEKIQRQEFIEKQREMRARENDEDYSIENEARNDSIAINQTNLDQTKIAREKNHLLAKQKLIQKKKDFEEEVENIISNLAISESYTFSKKLSIKQRENVHQICSQYTDIEHVSTGDGKNRQLTITKVEIIESSDDIKSNDDRTRDGTIEINERNVENEDEDEEIEQLSKNFSRRVGLRARKPIKYTK